jgi:hypothetical protein
MRYAIGAILSGLFIVGLLLCCESIAPAPSETTVFDKGYNAGFQMGTEETLKAAVDKGLGEFYFNESTGREAFRWFVDVRQTQGASADAQPTASDSENAGHQYVAKRTLNRHGALRKHRGHKPREARVDAGLEMELTALRGEGV